MSYTVSMPEFAQLVIDTYPWAFEEDLRWAIERGMSPSRCVDVIQDTFYTSFNIAVDNTAPADDGDGFPIAESLAILGIMSIRGSRAIRPFAERYVEENYDRVMSEVHAAQRRRPPTAVERAREATGKPKAPAKTASSSKKKAANRRTTSAGAKSKSKGRSR